MSHSPEEVRKHIKVYVTIFVSLLVLTVLTVGVSYVHLGTANNIAVGLFIAAVKASLVMFFFMHLKGERKPIYWVLYLTAIFFVFLISIPLYSGSSRITGEQNIQPPAHVSPHALGLEGSHESHEAEGSKEGH